MLSSARTGLLADRAAFALIIALVAAPVWAQSAARFTVDSVVSVDAFGGENISNNPQVIVDVSAGVRLGDHWQIFVRPWFRLPRPSSPTASVPDWDKELYQAGIRYERSGSVGIRADAGYIVSPIGLGLLDSRPSLNPTILPHLTYLISMPSFDPTVAPRQVPVASTYPLGAVVVLSTSRWDARAAIVNSSPTRIYVAGATTTPRQTPVVVGGAGVTPLIGLRVGASVARGSYATAEEVTGPLREDRSMTMIGGEGEFAFGYSKFGGEIVRTSYDAPAGNAVAYEWFVQGIQTLSPRWFVAARHEGTSAPPSRSGAAAGQRTTLRIFEATAGFRVNPDVTLRGSYDMREFFGASKWDHQAGASLVWAHRWW